MAMSDVEMLRACVAKVACVLLAAWLAGQATAADAPDFATEIVPLLTKAGCNAGACHGAAAGRGYLQLSLFGSRPTADYEAIVHAPGRRLVSTANANQSLLLMKPTELLAHGGGERLKIDSADYQLLKSWIDAGAPRGSMRKLTRIDFTPVELNESSQVIARVGDSIAIGVTAHWSDSSRSDVTKWASIDGEVSGAVWDADRLMLRADRVGVWTVTLRVASMARSIQIIAQPLNVAERPSAAGADMNSIDAIVLRANEQLGLKVAGPAAAHVMARRLWMDLLGRHPTLTEWREATKLIASGRKVELVDRLLASDEFTVHAAKQLTWWVQTSRNARVAAEVNARFAQAIQERLEVDDRLLNAIREMLSPEPLQADATRGIAEFHRYANDPRQRAELIASTFMGVRIGCAQCHDHPLDHWTQDDYFALAACWSEIESGTGPVRRIVGRTTTDLRSGKAATARLPSGEGIAADVKPDVAFTNWLCDPQNDFVTNNIANRLWAWMFGRGLVSDLDDHRETNPPTNRQLLKHLVDELRRNEFRLRPALRSMLLSDTYARASVSTGRDVTEELLLRAKLGGVREVKEIESPEFVEMVRQALDVANETAVPAMSSGSSAMMQAEPEASGCSRSVRCKDPFSASLDLVAGEELESTLAHPSNAINRKLRETESIGAALSETYERLFGEEPGDGKLTEWQRFIDAASNAKPQESTETTASIAQDIVWSWLVSDGFRKLE